MSKSKSKLGLAHIFFLVAGLLLVIKFLMEGGIPSPSNGIINFIVGVFELVVIVGFYCFFLFNSSCSSTVRALAPCMLLLILFGKYSLNFGNADVNKYLVAVGEMCWFLIIMCGFVYLFIHNKLVGTVFTYASIIYCLFVTVSYIVMAIIFAVNNGKFDVNNFVSTMLLVVSLALIGYGSFKITKRQDW